MDSLRIVFMGTPLFSKVVLEGLLANNLNIVLVVSQPDKMVGRKKEIVFSPVKQLALDHNIEVFQPVKIREDYNKILEMKPDIIITCAYGQIIPNQLLNFPKYKCINVHASLLPKLRGGAPIHHAIIDGLEKTGITIMYMAEKMDAGDILTQKEIEILDTDTTGTLEEKLSIIGRDLLLETLPKLVAEQLVSIPQNVEEVTYAWNIKRGEELLDFSLSTKDVYNKIRGLNPAPGAYVLFGGKIMKVFEARKGERHYNKEKPGSIQTIYKDGLGIATIDGEIIFTEIQIEGKKRQSVKDFLNGHKKEELLLKVFNEEV